jgi:hypothetical protein
MPLQRDDRLNHWEKYTLCVEENMPKILLTFLMTS